MVSLAHMRYLLLLLVLSFVATSTFFFVEARKPYRSSKVKMEVPRGRRYRGDF